MVTAVQALKWKRAGFSESEADKYIREGLSLEEALLLKEYNIAPTDIAGLIHDAEVAGIGDDEDWSDGDEDCAV